MLKRLSLLIATAFMALFLSAAPAQATEGCVISVAGIKVCGTLLGEPLPEVVTVTVTPDPIRIPVPGPTVTVQPDTIVRTVTPPPIVRTETVPGPTETVTIRVPGTNETVTGAPAPQPTATKTVTVPSAPQSAGPQNPSTTVTERTRSPRATETATATATETVTRQAEPERGTLDPDTGFFSDDLDFGDGDTTAPEVGLGLVAMLAIAGMGLFLLYLGYILGYKNSEKADTDFMRALRDQILARR